MELFHGKIAPEMIHVRAWILGRLGSRSDAVFGTFFPNIPEIAISDNRPEVELFNEAAGEGFVASPFGCWCEASTTRAKFKTYN